MSKGKETSERKEYETTQRDGESDLDLDRKNNQTPETTGRARAETSLGNQDRQVKLKLIRHLAS